MLATLSWLLLLLSGLLVLAALLAALVWIAHVNSSIELVFDAMDQPLLERISSISVGWHAKHRLLVEAGEANSDCGTERYRGSGA